MSIAQPQRVAQCIHPIAPLAYGGSYIILREGLDPLTRQPMVEVAGNQRYWAWRFTGGPAKPPGAYAHPNASGVGWHWRFN